MAWAEEKVYNQSGGGPFRGLIRKEGSTGADPMTWGAARVVNQGAFPNVGFGAGEMFSSPRGTNVEMRMEPEWYAQRGQPFMNQQIGTDEILDLYNEDENYAGGGIASLGNRPGYKWGGGAEGPAIDNTAGRMRWNPHPEMRESNKWDWPMNLPETKHDWPIGTGPNPLKAMGMTDDEIQEWYQKQAYKADGGAVGLEPGIGSLMGYAKGGMVTRVKVPKGQSRWMKRFMNSMRDS